MKIRLPRKEVEAVKRIARSKGIEHTTMLREWILEKIQLF
jgi:predicted DNA binding CopG/RHH family protein